jgi:outer membrane biosynthesis protein TonB
MTAVTNAIGWLAAALLAALLGLAVGCSTSAPPAPPPPTPTPTEATPVAQTTAAPQHETVRVVGSRLNVRSQPTTSAATAARVRKGERLAVLVRDGDWLQVQLADGTTGWVSARYVANDLPCTPDKPGAELLSDVPLSFREGAAIGRVVIEATVTASGNVAATKVVQDTTHNPELLARALEEAKSLKFAPPVHNCKPVGFLYTYTRNF